MLRQFVHFCVISLTGKHPREVDIRKRNTWETLHSDLIRFIQTASFWTTSLRDCSAKTWLNWNSSSSQCSSQIRFLIIFQTPDLLLRALMSWTSKKARQFLTALQIGVWSCAKPDLPLLLRLNSLWRTCIFHPFISSTLFLSRSLFLQKHKDPVG